MLFIRSLRYKLRRATLLRIVARERVCRPYLWPVELFLKFYTGKPSRIGVKYTYEFQAVKAYEDMVRLLGESELDALFELSRDRITLVLTSQFNGKQARYQALEFKSRELQKLRTLGAEHIFEFVHIYAQHNTLMVAKPFRKAEFFVIKNIELRGADFVKEEP